MLNTKIHVPRQNVRHSPGFWKEANNHRLFFDNLGTKLGINTLDDWYHKISRKLILDNGGATLLKFHKQSAVIALMQAYPEHNWMPWKFNTVPHRFWRLMDNQRRYLDWLAGEVGVKSLDEWSDKLSYSILEKHGGTSLLQIHGTSRKLLKAVYPEHQWQETLHFTGNESKFQQRANLRTIFEKKSLSEDEWSNVPLNSLGPAAVEVIKKHFQGSLYQALCSMFPQIEWHPWKFKNQTVSPDYWKESSNQRKFFDYLGKILGVQSLDDWYQKLSWKVLRENGGSGLIKIHNNSPIQAVMSVYPEHNWVIWNFKLPNRFWNSSENIRLFLSDLSEKLSIHSLDDWYRVDWTQLQHFNATALVTKYAGLYNLLKEHYPHHPWDPKRFKQAGKKSQKWLAVVVKKIFPNEGILFPNRM